MSENSSKRKSYRYDHHYYPLLKYWGDYQSKFAYLDSKGQALLSYAGILTATLILQVPEHRSDIEWDSCEHCAGELFTFLVSALSVLMSIICLLRTFKTSAGSDTMVFQNDFRKFESNFGPVDTTDREATVDWFLRKWLEANSLPPNLRKSKMATIETALKAENLQVDIIFENTEKITDKLRDVTEQEVMDRHFAYRLALFAICVGLFFFVVSALITASFA